MKRIALALVICLAIASMAAAEVLVTANPMGKGQMGWLAGGRYDTNVMGSLASNVTMISAGGYFGYGVMDNMDVYAKIGYGTAGNLPAVVSTSNGMVLGLAGKYTFMKESKDFPVTLAVAAGYQASTVNMNLNFGFPAQQSVMGDIGIGVIASKVMVPYVPYGAVNYHSLTTNPGATTGSEIEIAAGTQFLLSKSTAVVGELCLQSITSGGATNSNTQISVAYTAKI